MHVKEENACCRRLHSDYDILCRQHPQVPSIAELISLEAKHHWTVRTCLLPQRGRSEDTSCRDPAGRGSSSASLGTRTSLEAASLPEELEAMHGDHRCVRPTRGQ